MNESKRTLIYVASALVAVLLAAGTHMRMQPVSLDEFSDVGEEFYTDFKDPNAATALRVAAYSKDAARVDVFNVEQRDGRWRIPSHHNYPADGEERLAKTATSIIGITRDALASTSADDFRRLGVLDPLDESVTGTSGRGDRITLLQGDSILADYIIGTKVEGQDNVYHVRRPDENRTYRSTLDIDISTKFADWIEPDLLNMTRGDLREIVIDRYSVDETRGVIVPGEISRLTRDSSTASWELDGIGENQKVKTSEVNAVINALEDLTIVGVRPKPPGLSADLKGDGGAKLDAMAMIDLQNKGYFVDAEGALVSNEGEVRVGTAEGVLYVLRFGEVFSGSDVEIEVGKSNARETDSENSDSESAPVDASENGDLADGSKKQSRYLFITTQFHGDLIPSPGEKPVEPEKPASPSESDEQPGPDDADSGSDNAESTETSADDGNSDSSESPSEDSAEESSEDEEYQKALAEYQKALEKWENDQKAHEDQIAKGRERVKELNARFADWYYVISAETFDKIRSAPDELVETETPAEDGEDDKASGADDPAPPPAPAEEPAETESTSDKPAKNGNDESPTDSPSNSDPPASDASESSSPGEDAEVKPDSTAEEAPGSAASSSPDDSSE